MARAGCICFYTQGVSVLFIDSETVKRVLNASDTVNVPLLQTTLRGIVQANTRVRERYHRSKRPPGVCIHSLCGFGNQRANTCNTTGLVSPAVYYRSAHGNCHCITGEGCILWDAVETACGCGPAIVHVNRCVSII